MPHRCQRRIFFEWDGLGQWDSRIHAIFGERNERDGAFGLHLGKPNLVYPKKGFIVLPTDQSQWESTDKPSYGDSSFRRGRAQALPKRVWLTDSDALSPSCRNMSAANAGSM